MQPVARESDLTREFGPKACTERALQLGAYWVTEGNQGWSHSHQVGLGG